MGGNAVAGGSVNENIRFRQDTVAQVVKAGDRRKIGKVGGRHGLDGHYCLMLLHRERC